MTFSVTRQLSRFGWPLAALVAATLVVTLAHQNRVLRDTLTKTGRNHTTPHGGVWLPTFTASTLTGTPLIVGEDVTGGRQIVFVFTTTCKFCRASIPAWKSIAAAADTMHAPVVHVVGVSLDSLPMARRYATEQGLQFPVVAMPSPKLTALYRARSVPVVYVLDSAGRAIFGRVGVLETRAAIDSVLAAATFHQPAGVPQPLPEDAPPVRTATAVRP